MGLVINHNMMAMNAARNLNDIFGRLSTSTQRLSSGLRINSAADDAAGLAIREIMRSDIAVLNQGLRNSADAISMIQTAEGALSVIDEKLIRMKELAEQASTGTYTTVQRDIMNSEYQAMAAEIDRIANATDFNGIKLLDGSISLQHGGKGLKVHFGAGNDAAEDYYFINTGDARATVSTGLQVGGDAKTDIWAQGGTADGATGGCCGGTLTSLDSVLTGQSGNVFAYGYNHDLSETTDANLTNPSYLAGMYQVSSGMTLGEMVDAVNAGTQSRVRVSFASAAATMGTVLGTAQASGAVRICLNDEVYYFGSASLSTISGKENYSLGSATTATSALTTKINNSSTSFWAMASGANVFVFAKEGGDNDTWLACDEGFGTGNSATVLDRMTWQNMESFSTNNSGTTFGNGGETWGTMSPVQRVTGDYGVTLEGRDVGNERDLTIASVGSGASFDLNTSGTGSILGGGSSSTITGYGPEGFTEIQNAAWGDWKGADIRTQSTAQEALEKLDDAIVTKDKVRADLGALQNRLENTMTNISIQSEMLQASESRISDIDVATEMTEFTRNNIMAQAATSMLAQANSLAQLALSLMG